MSCEFINSPLLGKTKLPSDEERIKIKEQVIDCPLGTFQELNKHFNSLGLCLNISKYDKEK